MFLVKGKNNGRFPNSHSILIVDKDIVLLDTGCGIETLRQLKQEYRIDYVINSHTHPDHSAGNWIFKDRPIYVPNEGFDTSGNIVSLSERFVSRELSLVWQNFVKKHMGFRNCKPTNRYGRETIFNFGDTILKPIYTPGHTNDHYCFYEQKESILFSFDYDLTDFPWYGHRESSIEKFRESLIKLQAQSPAIVVSSHRGVINQNIRAEFERFRGIIDDRDSRILSLMKSAKTLDQIVESAPIYGKFPYSKTLLQYWEKEMIKKHLRHQTSYANNKTKMRDLTSPRG